MSTATATAKVQMYLVDDETLVFPRRRGEPITCRMRIWRAKDTPALVVIGDSESPDPSPALVEKVANTANRAYLSYLSDGMDTFVVSEKGTWLVTFDSVGRGDRAHLTNASRTVVDPREIAVLIGRKTEF